MDIFGGNRRNRYRQVVFDLFSSHNGRAKQHDLARGYPLAHPGLVRRGPEGRRPLLLRQHHARRPRRVLCKSPPHSSPQFQVRTCPALSQKTKEPDTPPKPEAKRTRVDAAERPSPFRPPYVPGLFVGALDGVDGEEKTSVIVRGYTKLAHPSSTSSPSSQTTFSSAPW